MPLSMPPPAGDEPAILCIPVKLDAFVFNRAVCDETAPDKAKIAPITQPNYTFLRVSDSLALNDVLPHVDLHNAAPATRNPRFINIGTGLTRSNRLGVYLHWMVPRPFRRGVAVSQSAQKEQHVYLARTGIRAGPGDPYQEIDHSAPVFLHIPNRWMIVRKLDPNATTTQPRGTTIPPVAAWIIESDRTRYIDDIGEDVDLQVDVSPFITAFLADPKGARDIKLKEQAEIFIGKRFNASEWNENESTGNVELTAASSSNQLFLDYQYHNGNVFSLLDTFDYSDNGVIKHLEEAAADYYVIGWQSDRKKDMMSMPTEADKKISRRDRLEHVAIEIVKDSRDPNPQIITDWLNAQGSTRSLCHGSLYHIDWKADWKTDNRPKVPANEFAHKLHTSMPLSVGTSPLDAILTYASERAQKCTLEDDIKQLQNLLRADDETVDAFRAAEVETESYNFADFDGGYQYDFLDDGSTYREPSQSESEAMILLNAKRAFYDSTERRIQQLRWQLFSTWWKYVSDTSARNRIDYGADAKRYSDELQALANLSAALLTDIKLGKGIPCGDPSVPSPTQPCAKEAAAEPFHQQNDPTLMLAGLKPGWPRDFGDKLQARLDHQIVHGTEGGKLLDKLEIPEEFVTVAKKLLEEFTFIKSSQTLEDTPPGTHFPLYHDLEYVPNKDFPVDDNPWRDRWSNRQPWFPLYLEWEAQYFHIPYEIWKFGDFQKIPSVSSILDDPECPCNPRPDPPSGPEPWRTGYFVSQNLKAQPPETYEPRSLSGRMLILPQPTFSLQVHLERLFNTLSPDQLDNSLPECEREKLKRNIDRLQFLSAPMAGFTNHLLTMYEGTHVKPLVRVPGRPPIALRDAEKVTDKLALQVKDIEKESDPTPYSTLPSLIDLESLAFKQVTHGQFRFTKLNIIDKFGQVVHAIDPLTQAQSSVYPSLTHYYKPQQTSAADKSPNVVDPNTARNPSMTQNEFIQVPLCINQPARWNADFVVHDTDTKTQWRPVTRWQNPIWGWIVVNYVDQGLQFFTREGHFFREVRITQGTTANVNWLPFPPADSAEISDTRQLSHLVAHIVSEQRNGYLQGMMAMINAYLENSATAPSAYGQYMNALVGKPLALVTMGWSLELSMNSRDNQSTLEDQKKRAEKGNRKYGLLPKDAEQRYLFNLKLGDKLQAHDGLVGYFVGNSTTDSDYNDLNLQKIYTHYDSANHTNLAPVSKTDSKKGYPAFKATWTDPAHISLSYGLDKAAQSYIQERNMNMQVFGAIVDPFRPVHGFSGALPLRSLSLPTWTWADALKKMATFFHAGPILTMNALPAFDSGKQMTRVDELQEKLADIKTNLALPALQIADWAWLQPYASSGPDPAIMPLGVQKAEIVASLKTGPYTATEGYMLLKSPVQRQKKAEAQGELGDDVDADFQLV